MLVVAAALFDARGRVLMHRRPMAKHHGGLWEFPGGKVESGESPPVALARELAEELAITVDPSDLVPCAFATETREAEAARVVILLYSCTTWVGEVRAVEGEGIDWRFPAACGDLAMPPLDCDLLSQVLRIGGQGGPVEIIPSSGLANDGSAA